jgi:3-oxoacyl-[acyl-carrier-protein] synthase-3
MLKRFKKGINFKKKIIICILLKSGIKIILNFIRMKYLNTVISGTGSCVPEVVIKNVDFNHQGFFDDKQQVIDQKPEVIAKKFLEITGSEERRYAREDQNTSDLATIAAQKAIEDAGIDKETIDQIILAHNFGDVSYGSIQSDILPCLAARVKHHLGIKNSSCVAYDILFGCPGWVQGVIQAYAYLKVGIAKRVLVIGADTLSRMVDKFDRDSMIYADGAGAAIIELVEEDEKRGIAAFSMQSDSLKEAYYLFSGKSNNPKENQDIKYLKMLGRKIYEYALVNVPKAMKLSMDHSGYDIKELKKVIIHQANEKMDEAIVERFFKLYDISVERPDFFMPMSIHSLGNSSVATIPTLYDDILKGVYPNQNINKGDLIMFASVGAGMGINSIVYKS